MARGGCPALSAELLLLLQPLSVLTFHLDLLFEHHHLPLGPPPAASAPGSPPALRQTVHAVLHWGGRLAQSLRGASGETPPGPSAPAGAPTPGSWWEQLTQASRVYASGGAEGFPLPRWRSWGPGTAAGGPRERPVPAEDAAPGRGVWLGRLFGVPGGLTETDGGTGKSRYGGSRSPPQRPSHPRLASQGSLRPEVRGLACSFAAGASVTCPLRLLGSQSQKYFLSGP